MQAQLLQASDTARYPHAHLFEQMLESELASPGTLWRKVWDTCLQKEMSYGRGATYQACLHLRLLLCRGNEPQRQEIANELVTDLSKRGKQHTQALITISNLYLRDVRDVRDVLNKDQIIGILNNMLKQQASASSSTALFALYIVLRAYDTTPPAIAQQVHESIQLYQRQRQLPSVEERQLTEVILRQIGISLTTFRLLTRPPAIHSLPDERATQLDALKQQDQLRKGDVEEILAACMDTREMSMEKWKELIQAREVYSVGTVGQFAWRLLSQPFSIEAKALPTVAQALNDSDAVVCAAAALLLQNCKKISQDMREDAAKRIIHILSDDELSRRPLDPPGEEYGKIWRLDDVLFETLKVLAE